jgi:hypothetical protein
MSTDTITPRDQKETSILVWSTKIAVALAGIGALLGGLFASVQGIDWFIANLPALISGLTALIGGGVATGLAVRRMKIDKAAKTLSILLCMAVAIFLQGCVGTIVEIPIQDKVVVIKRLAFCNAVAMPKISFIPSTGEISMEGYKSDGGSATIGIATEAAAKGAIMGMKGASGL